MCISVPLIKDQMGRQDMAGFDFIRTVVECRMTVHNRKMML